MGKHSREWPAAKADFEIRQLSEENSKPQDHIVYTDGSQNVVPKSRTKWIAEGEKITKYVCGLEKRNFVSKQILKLTRNDGSVLTETHEIVKEVNSFYKNLYEREDVEYCELSDLVDNVPQLSEEERTSLEGNISLEEASFALKKI